MAAMCSVNEFNLILFEFLFTFQIHSDHAQKKEDNTYLIEYLFGGINFTYRIEVT